MTNEELEQIQQHCRAATPGPWTSTGNMVFRIGTDTDAEFCAHAREDVPLLLAEVKRLWALISDRGQYTNRTTRAIITDRDELRIQVEQLQAKLREGSIVIDEGTGLADQVESPQTSLARAKLRESTS